MKDANHLLFHLAREFGWGELEMHKTPAHLLRKRYLQLLKWKKDNPTPMCPFLMKKK
jgi:hypothetical protein